MKRSNCGKNGCTARISIVGIALCLALFSFFGCAGSGANRTDAGALVLDSPNAKVSETDLEPGLSVVYVHGFWRNLYQMPSEERARKSGFQGEPIPNLNHRFGEGPVFASGRAKGVGLYLDGFIKFEKPGNYEFQANTNDGFRLTVNGEKIIEDSIFHSDRLSKTETVKVNEAGWYPLKIQYFQRKGTATIELYWKRPGDAEKSIIPPEAFARAS